MNIGWPEGIYLGMACLGLGVVLSKHGEPQPPYSFWTTLRDTILVLGLLYYGGFFA